MKVDTQLNNPKIIYQLGRNHEYIPFRANKPIRHWWTNRISRSIWNGIVSRGVAPSITDLQKKELDSRLADYLANPNDVLSWDEVKAAALAKIR